MLQDLNWRTLDQRRIDNRLVLLDKVTYDLVAIPASDYLIRNTRPSYGNHSYAYRQITALRYSYKYSAAGLGWGFHIPSAPGHLELSDPWWPTSCEHCQRIKKVKVSNDQVNTIYHAIINWLASCSLVQQVWHNILQRSYTGWANYICA